MTKEQLDKRRKWGKNFRRNNPIAAMLIGAKRRAKVRGLDFSLTRENIEVPTHCPVLGIPLEIGDDRQSPGSPSIHRVDPNKGYTPENSICISWRANSLLKDATLEELVAIATWLSIFQVDRKN